MQSSTVTRAMAALLLQFVPLGRSRPGLSASKTRDAFPAFCSAQCGLRKLRKRALGNDVAAQVQDKSTAQIVRKLFLALPRLSVRQAMGICHAIPDCPWTGCDGERAPAIERHTITDPRLQGMPISPAGAGRPEAISGCMT